MAVQAVAAAQPPPPSPMTLNKSHKSFVDSKLASAKKDYSILAGSRAHQASHSTPSFAKTLKFSNHQNDETLIRDDDKQNAVPSLELDLHPPEDSVMEKSDNSVVGRKSCVPS